MLCAFCSSENPEGAAGCAICGAHLVTRKDLSVLPPDTSLHHGTYSIVTCVGHGGFGITYQATDLKLRRPVAVKEYFPSGCTRRGATVQPSGGWSSEAYEDGRARFLQEGEALARFDHPGIVRVHAAFEENETAYVVMEFLHGKTLEQTLRERGGRLPAAETRICAELLAAALEVVHGAGLLHRDIKPANVMVVGNGSFHDRPRVVLVDFGAAREFVAGVSQNQSVVLTRGYAPLEQYAQRAPRGPFTDLYALSALLYQALTGAIPPDAADRIHGDTLIPVAEANPDVDPSLARAVMRGLAMEAARRPQSVREFVAEMDGVAFSPSPVEATQAPTPAPLRPIPPAAPGAGAGSAGASPQAALAPTERVGPISGGPLAPGLAEPDPGDARGGTRGGAALKWGLVAVVLVGLLLGAWALAGRTREGLAVRSPEGGAASVKPEPTRGAAAATKPSSPTPALAKSPEGVPASVPSGLESAGTNPQGFPEFRNPKDGAILVRIPGGTFEMGSDDEDDEKPAHSVILRPYLLARVPVTNAEFTRFASATGYDAGPQWKEYASKWGDQAPVVCVNWSDATEYAHWAGLRLPTEREWEFAARGPEGLTYPWGDEWDASKCQNGVGPRKPGKAAPVGSFPSAASPFGCLDMAGNVSQWTDSWYDRYPGNKSSNPAFGQKSRVLRGGSWEVDHPAGFRGSNRSGEDPDTCGTDSGFRTARSL